MRNIKKISLALLLVLTMLVQMIPAFAAVSPIVYEYGEDGSVTSYVYARDLENGAVLYTALYDAEGNFVSAVKSPVANKAGYLKTTVTPAEGQTVKSFIWDKSSNPFAVEGEYGDTISMDDVTITVNNVDLKELIAEDAVIADGASFDLDVMENAYKSTPVVRASSKDSQVECTVAYSADYSSATVTFTKGERILSDDAKTITNNAGASFVAERYTKPIKTTVTVNFVKNFISDSDLVSGSVCGGIVNANTCNFHFKKDYTLEAGTTAKQINLAFASIPNQSSVIIIEPKDKTADKMALVKADGTAPSWENDANVIKEFNYSAYVATDYNKVNKTLISATNQTPWACRELLYGDEGCEISSRYLTDRNPSAGGYQIYGIDGSKTSALAQALEGCNYIIYASGDKTNVTTSFYVGEDVTVHVFSNNAAVVPADVTADGNVAWDASTKGTSVLNKRYQNSIEALSVAWLMREGVITPADVTYQKNQNAWFDVNGDGRRQYGDATTNEGFSYLRNSDRVPAGLINGDAMSAYYTRRYDAIDYLVRESGSDSGWGFSNNTVKKDIVNSILPLYYGEDYKYDHFLNMWSDWTYTPEVAPLVKDFNHVSKISVTDLSMSIISGDHKGETATYTGDVTVTDGVKFCITDFFGSTITPDRSGLGLKNGVLENQNATGALQHYPDGFDLDNSTFICFTNGVANDAGYCYGSNGYYNPPKASYHDVWVNRDVSYPWYDFTVSRDAEVLVFASNDVKFLEDDENYDKLVLSGDDYLKVMRNMNTKAYYNMTRVYSANVKAGEKVEMKTPANGEVLYCVFVREARKPEINTNLSSISVDGVEIDGFDPEVKEYTYEIADPSVLTAPVVNAVAEDATSVVDVIPAKEFPGSTKIIVSSANGGTDVYTVNFTYGGDMLTNMTLLNEYVAPKSMIQWAIDSGKLKYTSDSDYKITGNNVPEYFKNGMVVGTKGFNARSYPIGVINDTSIVGKDVIIPSYSWIDSTMNASEAAFISAGQTGGVEVDNWLNFDISRKATVKLFFTNGSDQLKQKLQNQGYQLETNNSQYYFVVHNANGGSLRNYNVVCSRTFEAGTVSIPNGFTTADMYTVVIDYADYE